jgi:hypothetical protein
VATKPIGSSPTPTPNWPRSSLSLCSNPKVPQLPQTNPTNTPVPGPPSRSPPVSILAGHFNLHPSSF